MTPTRTQRRQHGAHGTITRHTVNVDAAPCQLDPTYWDAPPNDHLREERPRVLAAAKACRTECPSLAACMAFLAAWEHPDGVIAGQVWRDGVRLS